MRNLRSQGAIFKKDHWIFCQDNEDVTNKVAYMATVSKILDVAEKLQDVPLLLRLNNIPNASDAVVNDVQYHRKCWVAAQRKANVKESLPQELENINCIVADIEIQDIVENILKESTESVTDMKSLNTTYNNLLRTNEVNCKRYLKQLLLENVPSGQFVRLPTRNQSEQVCSSRSQNSVVEKNFRISYDDYQSIFQEARKIRKDIKAQEKWQFEGSFDGFSIPKSLQLLLGWIIHGPRMSPDTSPGNGIDKCVEILSELMMNMIKSDRQISYATKKGDGNKQMNETPLTVDLGLHLYKGTWSKVLIEH